MHGEDPLGPEDLDHRVQLVESEGELFTDDGQQDIASTGKGSQLAGGQPIPEVSHVQDPQVSGPEGIQGIVIGAFGMVRSLGRLEGYNRLSVHLRPPPALGQVQGVDHRRIPFDHLKAGVPPVGERTDDHPVSLQEGDIRTSQSYGGRSIGVHHQHRPMVPPQSEAGQSHPLDRQAQDTLSPPSTSCRHRSSRPVPTTWGPVPSRTRRA